MWHTIGIVIAIAICVGIAWAITAILLGEREDGDIPTMVRDNHHLDGRE